MIGFALWVLLGITRSSESIESNALMASPAPPLNTWPWTQSAHVALLRIAS